MRGVVLPPAPEDDQPTALGSPRQGEEQTTDLTARTVGSAPSPGMVLADDSGDDPSEVPTEVGRDRWTDRWGDEEIEEDTPTSADPPPEGTDPFGVNLPADEINPLGNALGSLHDWDAWEGSFFDRETQPMDPDLIPRTPPRPQSMAASVTLLVCGLIAVIALSISLGMGLQRRATLDAAAMEQPPVLDSDVTAEADDQSTGR